MKKELINIENKTLPPHTLYMIKILKDKRLYYLVDSYIELSYHLKKGEYSYLKRDLYLMKSLELKKKVIKYFDKYNIEYKLKSKERKKENKEKISNRQKKFIEKQKRIGKKKIQVYVDEFTYNRLLNMVHYKGVTQSEIINDCLLLGANYWDK